MMINTRRLRSEYTGEERMPEVCGIMGDKSITRHAWAVKKLVNSHADTILTGLSLQPDRLRAVSIDEIRQVDWPI